MAWSKSKPSCPWISIHLLEAMGSDARSSSIAESTERGSSCCCLWLGFHSLSPGELSISLPLEVQLQMGADICRFKWLLLMMFFHGPRSCSHLPGPTLPSWSPEASLLYSLLKDSYFSQMVHCPSSWKMVVCISSAGGLHLFCRKGAEASGLVVCIVLRP